MKTKKYKRLIRKTLKHRGGAHSNFHEILAYFSS